MRIAVIGLGKIGAALVAQYLSKGHAVVGCDINRQTVDLISGGQTPIHGEPRLEELIAWGVQKGMLSATTDTAAAVRTSNVVVVAVPLLIDSEHRPDYRAIDSATCDIARGLQPQTLVCFETTVAIGDTRNRFKPLLEQESGLQAGQDFCLAFSPERVKSGQILHDLATYPKVVGGIDEASTRAAARFYNEALDADIAAVGSCETAEFAKLAASFYRDVNIALANELAMCAQVSGIDAIEGIKVANTDPTSHIHEPGIGVGGHCIPVYPYFFIDHYPTTALLQTARQVNDGMAAYSVQLLDGELGSLANKNVLVLGLAFRANVKEATLSMAHLIVRELEQAGAHALVHDALFDDQEIRAFGMTPADLDAAEQVDAIIIQTFHDQYRELDFGRFTKCRVLIDGRNILSSDIISTLPCRYIGIGKPAVEGSAAG